MITLIALFLGFYRILSPFIDAIFQASAQLNQVLALMLIAFGALAIFAKMKWATPAAIITLIAMVALELLGPSAAMIEILGSLVLAIVSTVVLKRSINRYIRQDAARRDGPRLSPNMVTFLRLI